MKIRRDSKAGCCNNTAINQLVMVAENLASIPPNTSLMVDMADGKRHETRLESTEQSSAVIRFIRKEP